MAWRVFPLYSFPLRSPQVASNRVGVGHIIAAICRPGLPLLSRWFGPPCVATVAVTVGNNGTSFPPVRGIDGASRKYKRPAGVTAAFQVSKHLVERHVNDPSNVLSNHPSGP